MNGIRVRKKTPVLWASCFQSSIQGHILDVQFFSRQPADAIPHGGMGVHLLQLVTPDAPQYRIGQRLSAVPYRHTRKEGVICPGERPFKSYFKGDVLVLLYDKVPDDTAVDKINKLFDFARGEDRCQAMS